MASTSNGHTAPKRNATKVAPKHGEVKENRDPNNLNKYIQVEFYDSFGEPSTSPQSVGCVWEFSEILYDCCLGCWYKLFSLCCGICIAINWGCQLVPVLFTHVWLLTPCATLIHMVCGVWCRSFVLVCVRCAIKPCTNSCAYLFHNCGDGLNNRPETPPLFPKSVKRPKIVKPVAVEEPEKKVVVVAEKKEFEDYDKEKVAKSIRRQLMLY